MSENNLFNFDARFSLLPELEAHLERERQLQTILWIHYCIDLVICFVGLYFLIYRYIPDSFFDMEVTVSSVPATADPPPIESYSEEKDFINFLDDDNWGPV